MNRNVIIATDSYKLNHWNQYPDDTETVYSYFESREGARYPYTVFFGLQYLLKEFLVGQVVSWDDLTTARELAEAHFGGPGFMNYKGWAHVIEKHGGRLPLRIKAVPEGTVVPTGNVLMTIENTDPECFWLTNAIESLLTHVWYPSTVATMGHYIHGMLERYLKETAHDTSALAFMDHDFGYRGASSHESGAIGGAGHLVNSLGTDTLPAMKLAMDYYAADLQTLAFSVPATEHSVMTALGRDGEGEVVEHLLEKYPNGILSVVADSYNIYDFVREMGSTHKDDIMVRDGTFVVRPDSTTAQHPTPESLVVWIAKQLWHDFKGHTNEKGYKVLDSHVKMLWGDGIDPDGEERILRELALNSFSSENIVFGMGGGRLQKINRDTQRFAFKASAIERGGLWHDIYKEPLDATKTSKKGRLQLTRFTNESGVVSYDTLPEGAKVGVLAYAVQNDQRRAEQNVLQTVFEDGKLIVDQTFDEIRARVANTI